MVYIFFVLYVFSWLHCLYSAAVVSECTPYSLALTQSSREKKHERGKEVITLV